MDRTEANSGTRAVSDKLVFDVAALEAWIAAHVDGFAGPLTVTQFKGGQSNPTYRLDTPTRSYVLRRKPPGPLLPGAHAVEREARVMAALGQAAFPVPHIYSLCEDEGIIGTAFFVMDMVEGRIIWDPTFPGLTPTDRTPEATRPLLDREVPGIAEAIRAAGAAKDVPTAMLSRGLAGIAGDCLVINLPGSRGGVKDGLGVLGPVLRHAVEQVVGSDH